MVWQECIASRCRYGELAGRAFGEPEIIWEHSEDDYQGSANFLGQMTDGRFVHYEWSYGSCSGCDEWEAEGYSDEQIIEIMRSQAAFFPDVTTVKRYLHLEGFEHAINISEDFEEMGRAFAKWCEENGR